MKKMLLLVICGLMLLGTALAEEPETRTVISMIEGMEETVTLTRLDTGRGYEVWYDAQYFVLMPEDEGGGMDVLVPASEDAELGIAFSVVASGMTGPENVDLHAQAIADTLADSGYEGVTPVDGIVLENAELVAGYHGVQEGRVVQVNLVKAGEEYFTVTLEYPQEVAEGYGSRMTAMLQTFGPAKVD